jgi:Ca2+-binding RTX toxin-like protein
MVGVLFLCAACSHSTGGGSVFAAVSAGPSFSTSQTINAGAGGAINIGAGPIAGTTLIVPAGALAMDTEIVVQTASTLATATVLGVGPAVDFGPNGTTFSSPATVTIPFTPSSIPVGFTANNMVVAHSDSMTGMVTFITPTSIGSSTVTVPASSFSIFQAVLRLPNLIFGTFIGETLMGTPGDDLIQGLEGSDTISGGDGDDILFGGNKDDPEAFADGNDDLIGGNGNDTLIGGNGADLMFGEAGDDLFFPGSGTDLIDGADGIDTVDYSTSDVAVQVNLATPTNLTGGHADADQLILVENLVGSNFDDTLTGDPSSNVISGGAGNDVIVGGAGNDTINGDAGDDSLSGGDGDDILTGGPGADTMNGGAGNDTIIFDQNDAAASGYFFGAGSDGLSLGGNASVDLGPGSGTVPMTDLEQIVVSDGSTPTIRVVPDAVINITDSNNVLDILPTNVSGTGAAVLNGDTLWTDTGNTVIVNGIVLKIFTNSTMTATLRVALTFDSSGL